MQIRQKQIEDVRKAFELFPLELEIVAIQEQQNSETRRIDVRCLNCTSDDIAPIFVNVYDDGMEKSNHQAQLQLGKHVQKYHTRKV